MSSPEEFSFWYEKIFGKEPTQETVFYGLLAIILASGLIKFLYACWKAFKGRCKQIQSKLSDYSRYIGWMQNWLYIPAQFQSNPPEFSVDVSISARTEATSNLLKFYLKQVLVEKNKNKQLYMLLGGSGMGKTSFVVQLVRHYYWHYYPGKEPFELFLFPCGNGNILERISSVPNKESSVLILDALDESSEAIEGFDAFIKKLEDAIQPFRIVIVTCRTQFFDDSDHIRMVSALRDQGREKGFISYIHQYISPLKDEEINRYLWKRFLLNRRKRRTARRIVEKNDNLMVRPLLLSYIDDLVTEKVVYQRQADIYGTLIDKWIDREVAMIQDDGKRKKAKSDLYRLSVEFAVDIYLNRKQYGGLYMPLERYKQLENSNLIGEKTGHHYQGRSLINWDVSKHWKFAHKSFFEYFLAVKKVEDKSFVVSTEGMDLVDSFYRELCRAEVEKEIKEGRVVERLVELGRRETVMALIIKKRPQIDFRFFLNRPKLLVFDWSIIDEDLLSWLKSIGTNILIIKNYSSRINFFSRELVNVNGIRVIRFHSPITSISQNLQSSFRSNRIVCDIISRDWDEKSLLRVCSEYYVFMGQAEILARYRLVLNS